MNQSSYIEFRMKSHIHYNKQEQIIRAKVEYESIRDQLQSVAQVEKYKSDFLQIDLTCKRGKLNMYQIMEPICFEGCKHEVFDLYELFNEKQRVPCSQCKLKVSEDNLPKIRKESFYGQILKNINELAYYCCLIEQQVFHSYTKGIQDRARTLLGKKEYQTALKEAMQRKNDMIQFFASQVQKILHIQNSKSIIQTHRIIEQPFLCLINRQKIIIPTYFEGCNHIECYEYTNLLQLIETSKEKEIKCFHDNCENILPLDLGEFQKKIIIPLQLAAAITKEHPFALTIKWNYQKSCFDDSKSQAWDVFSKEVCQAIKKDEISQDIIFKFIKIVNKEYSEQLDNKLRFSQYHLNLKGIKYPARCIQCHLQNCKDVRTFLEFELTQQQGNFICPACNYYHSNYKSLEDIVYFDRHLYLAKFFVHDLQPFKYNEQEQFKNHFIRYHQIRFKNVKIQYQKDKINPYPNDTCSLSNRRIADPVVIQGCQKKRCFDLINFKKLLKRISFDLTKFPKCGCSFCEKGLKLQDFSYDFFFKTVLSWIQPDKSWLQNIETIVKRNLEDNPNELKEPEKPKIFFFLKINPSRPQTPVIQEFIQTKVQSIQMPELPKEMKNTETPKNQESQKKQPILHKKLEPLKQPESQQVLQKQIAPRKPEFPKEQPKSPKKPEPPKEQLKPEPPKKPEPTKEQPKPEPPKKPDPVVEQPPKKPEPPKQQPESPKKHEPPKEQPKKPEKLKPQFSDQYAIDLDFSSFYVRLQPLKCQQVPDQKPAGQVSDQKPSDFGFSDEDEKEIDKIGGEEGDEPFEQLSLITKETLSLINKYVKSTQYGKSTPIMTEELGAYEVIIQMFEEFILQDEAYFLDFDETQILFLIYEKVVAEEDCNQEIEECMKSIELKFVERTQKQGFGEGMKMYFPFEDNPFEFYLLEKDPLQKILILYYDAPPNEAVMGKEFEYFIQIFQQLFECEDYEISQVVVTPANQKKLTALKGDNKYLKYLFTLFTILYEQQQQVPEIEVTDDTVARAYWALSCCTDIYSVLQENEKVLRSYFMEILKKAKETDKANSVTQIEEYFCLEGIANIQDQIQMIYEDFLKNKQVKQYFFTVDIVRPQQKMKYTYYVHLSKVAQLNFLKVFMMQHYAEMNEEALPIFLTEDGLFTQKVYIDYARHNFLYEFGDASLGVWYHLIVKKNYKPEEAMGIMSFSLAPYNIIFSKQE